MFFCKSSDKACSALKRILSQYETASGQKINTQKSSIFFSRKTPADRKQKARDFLLIDKEGGVGKYLGLPELFGRKKKDLFSSIVDRIRQKALGWSNSFLSSAGKLVMFKGVLATLPTYAMSCFQLPISLCKRIQSALTRFWWDGTDQKRKMCWVSWEKMTLSKQSGGLGFRDLQHFNTALLAKLSWRILNKPSGLLSKILLGKYCSSKDFMQVTCSKTASHGWRSILNGRDLLTNNIGWAVGDGNTATVWYDAWIPQTKLHQPSGPATQPSCKWKVKDLFQPNSVDWDEDKINSILPQWKENIFALKPSRLGAPDKRVWLHSLNGDYSTKSGYYTAREQAILPSDLSQAPAFNWQSNVWQIQSSPKIKTFLWKALQGALPTGSQLESRGLEVNPACNQCGERETCVHLLFHCPFAKKVWNLAPFSSPLDAGSVTGLEEGVAQGVKLHCLPPTGLSSTKLFPWICWNLWISRNQLLFSKRTFTAEETVLKATKDALEWQAAQLSPPPNLEPQLLDQQPLIRLESHSPQQTVCRSDAAWRQDLKTAGLGWVFLQPPSDSVLHYSSFCNFVTSPLLAEALAVRAALSSARILKIHHIKLESDCRALVQAINTKSTILEIHGVLSDILISSLSFTSFTCVSIPRADNHLADSLAKLSLANFALTVG